MSTVNQIAEESFWFSFVLVGYTYLGYPFILFVCYAAVQLYSDVLFLLGRRERRISPPGIGEEPGVTFVIPAHNEEDNLPKKLANLQQTKYPTDRLQVVIVSDGSTDGTNEILNSCTLPYVEKLFLRERSGKPVALNYGVEHARYDILIFSDAATLFVPNAVANLVRRLRDPKIGVVCGAVQFRRSQESEQTEGIYWRFERVLRLMESRLGASVNASGAIYAVRKKCFIPLQSGDLIDDLLIPLNARKLGYKVIEDPEAMATDLAASTVKGEFSRRARLAVGSFRALCKVKFFLLPGFTVFAFLSHKVLRWLLPFLLIAMLASNAFLASRPFFRVLLATQIVFYLWGALGLMFHKRLRTVRFALFAYFLLMMHFAFLVGFYRFLFGGPETTWERTQ